MKSIKQLISLKLVKDERVENYTNKVKSEAYTIMMILAFTYIIAEAASVELRIIKENNIFILFMVGALYTTVRLALKGLYNYSPIKGMHPISFITLTSGITAVVFGVFLSFKNTILYLDGKFSKTSIIIFVSSTIYLFILLETICLLTYYISKKREEKYTKE